MATMPRFTIMREDVSHVYAREYGVARDSATITAAILDIGQDHRTLVLSDDEDGLWVLTTDVTIPSNIWLSIPPGVTVTGTAALTIQGGLLALRSNWYQSTGPLTWVDGEGELHLTRLKGGSSSLQQLVLPGVPLAITEGGTGARTAPLARSNLGLTIGTNVQAYDATLQALAGLPVTANTLPYFTGVDQSALTPFTPYMRTLLDDPDAPTARVTLGLGALAPLSMVTTPYVADKNITYAKLQDIGAFRLLGNSTGVPATAQDIVVGAGLQLSGGILSLTGGYIAGSGQDGTVALWSGAGSQTYDPNLVWDRTAHRLGINVAVPAYGIDMVGSMQLTGLIRFNPITGRKMLFYGEVYGLGIEPSELRLFTSQGARLTLGGMSEAQVYTPLVYVDTATARVGINSTTPGSTLSVLGNLHVTAGIGANAAPVAGYAIWTNENWSYFGGRVGIGVAPGHALHVAGDVGIGSSILVQGAATFNNIVYMASSVHCAYIVSIAGAPDGGWNFRNYGSTHLASLNVGGHSTLANVTTGRLGVAYAVDGNYWLRSGNAYIDAITCPSKIVAGSFGYNYDPPRWPLDINGQGFVFQMGVYYGPDVAAAEGIDFRTRYAHFDCIGVGYAANASYSIRSGNIYCDAIGAGYPGGSGYHFRCGSAAIDSMYAVNYASIGGGIDTRWNFVNWGSSYFNGTTQFIGVIGMGGYAPDGGYSLRVGSVYVDQMGVGTPPYAGWNLTAGNILAWSNIQSSNTLYIAGVSTFAGTGTFHGGITVVAGQSIYVNPGGGGVFAGGVNEGVRYQGVGNNIAGGYSHWTAFGWDGTVRVRIDGTQMGYITLNGSDERMKCDLQADVPGLDAVLALRPISFAWDQTKRTICFPAGRHYGLLAQQAQPHVPLAIGDMQDDNHWLTLDYQALVPVLIQAFQDLDQRTEARMRALEARLAALEAA